MGLQIKDLYREFTKLERVAVRETYRGKGLGHNDSQISKYKNMHRTIIQIKRIYFAGSIILIWNEMFWFRLQAVNQHK